MKKKIIFLESSVKKTTIGTFLGRDYVIFATGGHLQELKKTGVYNLGVDLEKKFKPIYEIIPDKKRFIDVWKDYLVEENIGIIYLATDPDREGEAIAREITEILDLDDSKYQRLLFYEITPRNIHEALSNPVTLNKSLVEAQVSRQVLDRMIGFCISPLLQRKLQAPSAGRVQSVVLKLIVERESLIEKHEKKKEYIICAPWQKKSRKIVLKQVNSERELITYPELKTAEKIKEKLNLDFTFLDKKEEKKFVLPKSPFTTSLLLFEAKSRLGFSISQTTQLAQKLYEGIWIPKEKKQVGLITYPRTDSTRINQEFIQQSRKFICEKWGNDYYNPRPAWENKEKKTNVQGAHESIHPTYLEYHPEYLKDSLAEEEYKLYELIFRHTLASLMSPARVNKITYCFLNNNDYYFATTERVCQFAGFLSCAPDIYFSSYNIKNTAELNGISLLSVERIEVQEYLEKKPTRFNEGSLVQELERLGIGRPSTYNTFGRLLLQRKYAELNEKGHFIPTELGRTVNRWLQENFSSLINENYTALLEAELDKISQGGNNYLTFIKNFWEGFSNSLQKVENQKNLV